jgi:uncharacterized protein (TIGR00730 family)
MTIKTICVYCSSSDAVAPEFFSAAESLGQGIGARGLTLVFGGCKVGLMGAVARATKSAGGRVVGVIPDSIHTRGLAWDGCDEVQVTHDMATRKLAMESHADAFIALPGGFGTLEEITQAITLKQLQYHEKPVILVNTHGFYDPLLAFFEHTYELNFAKATYRELYHVSPNADEVFEYLDHYSPPKLVSKWFEK